MNDIVWGESVIARVLPLLFLQDRMKSVIMTQLAAASVEDRHATRAREREGKTEA